PGPRARTTSAHYLEVPDRLGRETYALVRGDGSCPTVLVHGGIGSGSPLQGPVVIPDRPRERRRRYARRMLWVIRDRVLGAEGFLSRAARSVRSPAEGAPR